MIVRVFSSFVIITTETINTSKEEIERKIPLNADFKFLNYGIQIEWKQRCVVRGELIEGTCPIISPSQSNTISNVELRIISYQKSARSIATREDEPPAKKAKLFVEVE